MRWLSQKTSRADSVCDSAVNMIIINISMITTDHNRVKSLGKNGQNGFFMWSYFIIHFEITHTKWPKGCSCVVWMLAELDTNQTEPVNSSVHNVVQQLCWWDTVEPRSSFLFKCQMAERYDEVSGYWGSYICYFTTQSCVKKLQPFMLHTYKVVFIQIFRLN